MQQLTTSLVNNLIIGLSEIPTYHFGLPFVSEEGCVLMTADGQVIISEQSFIASTELETPLLTESKQLILTNDDTVILGA